MELTEMEHTRTQTHTQIHRAGTPIKTLNRWNRHANIHAYSQSYSEFTHTASMRCRAAAQKLRKMSIHFKVFNEKCETAHQKMQGALSSFCLPPEHFSLFDFHIVFFLLDPFIVGTRTNRHTQTHTNTNTQTQPELVEGTLRSCGTLLD